MKTKLLLLLVSAATVFAVAVLGINVRDGKPLFSTHGFDTLRFKADQSSQTAQSKLNEAMEDSKLVQSIAQTVDNTIPPDHIYRWKGSDGQWAYGKIPPNGVEKEVVNVSNVNTLNQGAPKKEGQ